jgi:hypothetical protein
VTPEEGSGKVVIVVPETAAAEVAGSEKAIVEATPVITPVTTTMTTVIRVRAARRQTPPGCGH